VTTADNAVAVDNSGNTKWSKAGYFYQFLDQELMYSYKVGSYLGTKKVFNIGAGFIRLLTQPNLR
jgi:predicted butyrate kinase (DUF1464 family)